jgi:membrane protein implicated in regulation of membrane protease activity
MSILVLLWVLFGGFLLLAARTPGHLYTFMLALGAFGSAVAAALKADVPAQIAVFALVPLVGTVLFHFLVGRHVGGRASRPTLGHSVPRAGVVLEPISAERGAIKVDGEIWQARALDRANVLNPRQQVRVVTVRDGLALVSPAAAE